MRAPKFTLLLLIALLGFAACGGSSPSDDDPPVYTVTFNANNETANTTKEVSEGGKVTAPDPAPSPAPGKENYGLGGWYRDDGTFADEWDFENDTVTADITLYARWGIVYTVTFNANNETDNTTQKVIDGNKASVPTPDPVKENYGLDGWYRDDGTFADEWDFDTNTVTADITLHAKWGTLYTVTFNANNGTDNTTQKVTDGKKASAPNPAPTNAGKGFGGWYRDDGTFADEWDFENDTVTADITLYARWIFVITNVNEVASYLAAADEPAALSMKIDLGTMTQEGSGWRQLLDAIATADKFVELDLSECTLSGTEFNPDCYIETGKDKIVSIALPDTAEGIIASANYSYSAFEYFTALVSFSGEGLTSIGNWAFRGCTNLALESLPVGITSIGNYAFSDCTNLALTSLPAGLTEIGGYTFEDCTNLALDSLPTGIESIGNWAFGGCTNLALTSLPESLTSIGENAFSNCTSLALDSLPAGLTSIGYEAFGRCTSLALESLPVGITSIEWKTFSNCTSLERIILHEGIISINGRAFEGCTSLEQITLPESLISIGDDDDPSTLGDDNLFEGHVFEDCTSLALIICKAETPPTLVGNTMFSADFVLKVPAGSVAAYEADVDWNFYASEIIAIEE